MTKQIASRYLLLQYLRTHDYITRACALTRFQIQNLADQIMKLRREGYNITKFYRLRDDGLKIVLYQLQDDDESNS